MFKLKNRSILIPLFLFLVFIRTPLLAYSCINDHVNQFHIYNPEGGPLQTQVFFSWPHCRASQIMFSTLLFNSDTSNSHQLYTIRVISPNEQEIVMNFPDVVGIVLVRENNNLVSKFTSKVKFFFIYDDEQRPHLTDMYPVI